ncbi:MAG: hypothetical protein H6828_06655 [Planctomycetes bacterium]|nr:hypothetical protein [Planctomycetota bacterium]
MLQPRLLALTLALVAAAPAAAQNLTVLSLADGGLRYWGQSGGIAGYSVAVTACNGGAVPIAWSASDHPVLVQNLYRLHDGRFEQIGMSWCVHEFCALNEPGCGTCQSTGCDTLGAGCASSHSATLCDGQQGGPRSEVLSALGVHLDPPTAPSGPSAIAGRLQVHVSDLDPAQFPGARYFVELMYVDAQDVAAGVDRDNVSWRELQVVSATTIVPVGATHVGESALEAWRLADPEVVLTPVDSFGEFGASGVGRYLVAQRVQQLGGTWRYDWVVQNLTSSAAARALVVDFQPGGSVSGSDFRDIAYHSGEPYDTTPWSLVTGANELRFECAQTFAQNPFANALRFGTAYGMRIETDVAPVAGVAGLELFQVGGGPAALLFPSAVPAFAPGPAVPFCFASGDAAPCPCGNDGLAGAGCRNAGGVGASLAASGSASVSAADLVLFVSDGRPGQFCVFVQGGSEVATPFRDGVLCAGNPKLRLATVQLDGAGAASLWPAWSAVSGVTPGAARVYQVWYRDPVGPCGQGSNLSSALRVLWTL